MPGGLLLHKAAPVWRQVIANQYRITSILYILASRTHTCMCECTQMHALRQFTPPSRIPCHALMCMSCCRLECISAKSEQLLSKLTSTICTAWCVNNRCVFVLRLSTHCLHAICRFQNISRNSHDFARIYSQDSFCCQQRLKDVR